MSTAKRIKTTRFVRIVRTSVALAARLAAVAPAHAASPDSVDVARVEQQLQEAQYARIGIAGRTHVLIRPRFAPEGLEYEHVQKFPRHRYEVVAGADLVAPPPRPVPWSSIEQIETGDRSRSRGALISGSFGFLIGAGMGAGLALYGSSASGGAYAWQAPLAIGAIFGVVGAGFGALFPSTKWKQVYPHAMEPAQR
jgi:hypothetical protein